MPNTNTTSPLAGTQASTPRSRKASKTVSLAKLLQRLKKQQEEYSNEAQEAREEHQPKAVSQLAEGRAFGLWLAAEIAKEIAA